MVKWGKLNWKTTILVIVGASILIPLVRSIWTKGQPEVSPQNASIETNVQPAAPQQTQQPKVVEKRQDSAPKPQQKRQQPQKLASKVSVQDLILDLGDADNKVAFEAALRLVRKDEAIESLVGLYSSSDATMKKRILWCLKRMGEPARCWFNKVLANPDDWRPRLVLAAKDIFDELEGNFDEKLSNSRKKIENIKQKEEKSSNSFKELEENHEEHLLALKERRKFLVSEKVKREFQLEWACRNANRTHDKRVAEYVLVLREQIEQLKEGISFLTKDIKTFEKLNLEVSK